MHYYLSIPFCVHRTYTILNEFSLRIDTLWMKEKRGCIRKHEDAKHVGQQMCCLFNLWESNFWTRKHDYVTVWRKTSFLHRSKVYTQDTTDTQMVTSCGGRFGFIVNKIDARYHRLAKVYQHLFEHKIHASIYRYIGFSYFMK